MRFDGTPAKTIHSEQKGSHMGFLAFGIFCFITLAMAWIIIWVLGYFLPGHPALVDKIIWGIALLMIVLKLLAVTGLMAHDPQIPHV